MKSHVLFQSRADLSLDRNFESTRVSGPPRAVMLKIYDEENWDLQFNATPSPGSEP